MPGIDSLAMEVSLGSNSLASSTNALRFTVKVRDFASFGDFKMKCSGVAFEAPHPSNTSQVSPE
jgi:hypothetical protein